MNCHFLSLQNSYLGLNPFLYFWFLPYISFICPVSLKFSSSSSLYFSSFLFFLWHSLLVNLCLFLFSSQFPPVFFSTFSSLPFSPLFHYLCEILVIPFLFPSLCLFSLDYFCCSYHSFLQLTTFSQFPLLFYSSLHHSTIFYLGFLVYFSHSFSLPIADLSASILLHPFLFMIFCWYCSTTTSHIEYIRCIPSINNQMFYLIPGHLIWWISRHFMAIFL